MSQGEHRQSSGTPIIKRCNRPTSSETTIILQRSRCLAGHLGNGVYNCESASCLLSSAGTICASSYLWLHFFRKSIRAIASIALSHVGLFRPNSRRSTPASAARFDAISRSLSCPVAAKGRRYTGNSVCLDVQISQRRVAKALLRAAYAEESHDR